LPTAKVTLEQELYAAGADALLARIRQVPETVESVMVIGHNPGLHQLALVLASTGDELDRLEAKFPTAALATLALASKWRRVAPGDATLAAYVVPKQLR
jgi:phosphohistidine phosphatase